MIKIVNIYYKLSEPARNVLLYLAGILLEADIVTEEEE
jgi:hypothetical protein